jgi:transcription initiation factor IIE alpha subunit
MRITMIYQPRTLNTLKKIFDFGEFVHRLINSDIYGQMAEMQDEQMKERLEFRKNVLKK